MSEISPEWEQLMNESIYKREIIKQQIQDERDRQSLTTRMNKIVLETKWNEKTSSSPLNRDLVTDIDRAVAEAKVQEIERQKRSADSQANRETVRQTLTKVIMKDSTDELHVLREQRRRIEVQEKRLKALLEIEKSKLIHKGDYYAARNGLKQRRDEKLKERRQELSTLQKKRTEQETIVKKIAAGLAEPPAEIILGLRAIYNQNGLGSNTSTIIPNNNNINTLSQHNLSIIQSTNSTSASTTSPGMNSIISENKQGSFTQSAIHLSDLR